MVIELPNLTRRQWLLLTADIFMTTVAVLAVIRGIQTDSWLLIGLGTGLLAVETVQWVRGWRAYRRPVTREETDD